MTNFFTVDISQAVDLFEDLNAVTHRRGEKPPAQHIRALRQRVVSLLTAMLDAASI